MTKTIHIKLYRNNCIELHAQKKEKKKMNQKQNKQLKKIIEEIENFPCACLNCQECPFIIMPNPINECDGNFLINKLKLKLLKTCPTCGQAIPTN